jgi:hypothetical protein
VCFERTPLGPFQRWAALLLCHARVNSIHLVTVSASTILDRAGCGSAHGCTKTDWTGALVAWRACSTIQRAVRLDANEGVSLIPTPFGLRHRATNPSLRSRTARRTLKSLGTDRCRQLGRWGGETAPHIPNIGRRPSPLWGGSRHGGENADFVKQSKGWGQPNP